MKSKQFESHSFGTHTFDSCAPRHGRYEGKVRTTCAAVVLGAIGLVGATGVAGAAPIIVNSVGVMGPITTLTFDSPADNSIAKLAGLGVNITSLDASAHPFLSSAGGPGIGPRSDNALGNTRNGLLSDISAAPDLSGSALRAFDISFNNAVEAFGLSIQGWGVNASWQVTHHVSLFDESNALIADFSFAALGLTTDDNAPNGFFGILGNGAKIKHIQVTPGTELPDFVAFDNLTFRVAAVPEPTTVLLFIVGLLSLALRKPKKTQISKGCYPCA